MMSKFLRRCLLLVLTLGLMLSGCSSFSFLQKKEAPQPIELQTMWYENQEYTPKGKVLANRSSLYLTLEDLADFLELTVVQGNGKEQMLHTPAGTLSFDEKGNAALEGDPLEGYFAYVGDAGELYLPLAQTEALVDIWYNFDERHNSLFVGNLHTNNYADTKLVARAKGTDFYFYDGTAWQAETLRGVNMGLTLPGQHVGEGTIPYETYLDWFTKIGEMNANALRVYTRQPPAFYQALRKYNQQVEHPIWLYQGVWVEQGEALEARNVSQISAEAQALVDDVHGQDEVYSYDVSPWLGGWIIGSEWTADYITATNAQEQAPHEGELLYTVAGTPTFETRLCAIADGLVTYQSKTYGSQSPLAFLNWPTTDTLKHPSEAVASEDSVSFDSEKIMAKRSFLAGLFALYHVYPTYPEFIAQEGKKDGYAEYLERLYGLHTVPAVVGEYGASSSRGTSHRGQDGWYVQGGLSEAEQGEQNVALTRAIFASGFNGAMLFSWQDEWFKDVWNVHDQTLASRNPFWYNAQNSEQSYGLLGAFPGEGKPPVYIDGEDGEWQEKQLVAKDELGALYATYDEGYLYLLLRLEEDSPAQEGLYLPLSIDANSGLGGYKEAGFEKKSQFLLTVDSAKSARLLVSADYDAFAQEHGNVGETEDGSFHPLRQFLREAYTRPDTGEKIAQDVVETGALRAGNTNPEAEDFDSLADFCWRDNCLEIRLPWMLIGFMDPSNLTVMAPLTEGREINTKTLDKLAIGFGAKDTKTIAMTPYKLQPWGDSVNYHLRLKAGYTAMQEVFAEYR